MTCPLKRRLGREWSPRQLGKPRLAAVLGTAVAAGLAVFNSSRRVGVAYDGAACALAAVQSVRMQVATMLAAGCVIAEHDRAQADALEGRASKAILSYIAKDPLPPTWTILDVERILVDAGNARIDLGVDTPMGACVVDYKVKLTWDVRYKASDVAKYGKSEQRFHYSVYYGDFIGRPIHAFYICVLTLEPRFNAELFPFINDPEILQMWRGRRESVTYPRMAKDEEKPDEVDMAADHYTRYGPCEFQAACFDYKLDESLMAQEYVKGARE